MNRRMVRVLTAPFSRRSWAELGYLLVSVPLAVAGFAFAMVTAIPPLLAGSAPGVRRLGDANRGLARGLLGADEPAPPRDLAAIWRARGYLVLKLPFAVAGLTVAAVCWLGGLLFLTFPAWWAGLTRALPTPSIVPGIRQCRPGGLCVTLPVGNPVHGAQNAHVLVSVDGVGSVNLAHYPLEVALVGAALLLVAPWLTRAVIQADQSLIRRLLGPATLDDRVRALQETRAHAVDDSAARLRGIERDLHDGTQARLVSLGVTLGRMRRRVADPEVLALVTGAQETVADALTELRDIVRGIHPPALDAGLRTAVATLAARSAVPVETAVDLTTEPPAATASALYFSTAELLTNVSRHAGATRAGLRLAEDRESFLLEVTDDGRGGATLDGGGTGLSGLARRAAALDGTLRVESPPGGPTAVTMTLPKEG